MTLEKNLMVIKYIDPVLKQRFPYGGINRVDAKVIIAKHHNLDPNSKEVIEIYQQQYELAQTLYDPNRNFLLADYENEPLLRLFGANCDHLVQYAALKILAKFPGICIEAVGVGAHSALVIGRPLDSDPYNISTWNGAIIYGPWEADSYLATNYYSRLARAPRVPFYINYTSIKDGELHDELVINPDESNHNPSISRLGLNFYLLSKLDYAKIRDKYVQDLKKEYSCDELENCLFIAAAKGDIENIQFLIIYCKITPNCLSSTHETALEIAVTKEKELTTEFSKAVGSKREQLQQRLINIKQCICELNSHIGRLEKDLRQAANDGNFKKLQQLVVHYKVNPNSISPTGKTALYFADGNEKVIGSQFSKSTGKEREQLANKLTGIRECIYYLKERGAIILPPPPQPGCKNSLH